MLGGVTILAETGADQTWWVVTTLVLLLISVSGFAFRQLWSANQELRAEKAKLEDQQEAERHATLMRGIDDVKAETRGLRNEVHNVTERIVSVERRVDTVEGRVGKVEMLVMPEGRH